MMRESFILEVQAIVERVKQCAHGVGDHLGELTPEQAAEKIANLVPIAPDCAYWADAGFATGERGTVRVGAPASMFDRGGI